MSSFDPDLLQRLASADAAAPPAPGADFSSERLAALATRRARRQLWTVAAAMLVVAFALFAWPRTAPDDHDVEARTHAEFRALRAELDQLQATMCTWSTEAATAQRAVEAERSRRAATNELRFELAQARAGAVLALWQPSPAVSPAGSPAASPTASPTGSTNR